MLRSVKELLWNPAATDWVEDRIAQPKQMAAIDNASPGVVVVRVCVNVSSNDIAQRTTIAQLLANRGRDLLNSNLSPVLLPVFCCVCRHLAVAVATVLIEPCHDLFDWLLVGRKPFHGET